MTSTDAHIVEIAVALLTLATSIWRVGRAIDKAARGIKTYATTTSNQLDVLVATLDKLVDNTNVRLTAIESNLSKPSGNRRSAYSQNRREAQTRTRQ